MPIYNAAIKAVDELDKNDITEIKGFQKPPEAAKAVMKTMCILYGVPPERVKGGNVKDV
jgi:dynein heavy chain